uniref:Uncharacterized protein n=1 Tax=Fusarium oxysporum (strain Fo5176) TaxID=660025 RepID=A0A0D2XAQ3_FUSOF
MRWYRRKLGQREPMRDLGAGARKIEVQPTYLATADSLGDGIETESLKDRMPINCNRNLKATSTGPSNPKMRIFHCRGEISDRCNMPRGVGTYEIFRGVVGGN